MSNAEVPMSDASGIKVLAICGSLRKGSYNMAALRTAIAQKPPGMTIEVADISQIPLYNEDVRQQGFPPPVETLRRQIAAADALLFACPEYNYSMSGVLKNAIDWASRPPDQPGAGNGIGRATALAFGKSGAKVVVVDRDTAGGEATVGILRQQGGEARFVAADVTKSADVAAYVQAALDAYGRIDCFHNNAGIEG